MALMIMTSDDHVGGALQSTDKNFMVPVGGAVVAEGSRTPSLVQAVNEAYPGRAAIGPALDVLITLLEWGASGWTNLLAQRDALYKYAKKRLEALAAKHHERVLCTPQNPISLAMTLCTLSCCRSNPPPATCEICGSVRSVPTARDHANPSAGVQDVGRGRVGIPPGGPGSEEAGGPREESYWREGVRTSLAELELLEERPGVVGTGGAGPPAAASAKSRSAPPTPRTTSPHLARPSGAQAGMQQPVPGARGFLHDAVPEEAVEPPEGSSRDSHTLQTEVPSALPSEAAHRDADPPHQREGGPGAPQYQGREAGAGARAEEARGGSKAVEVPAGTAQVPQATGAGAPPQPAGGGEPGEAGGARAAKGQLTSEYPVTFLGSMLFSRGVTGARVVAPGKPGKVAGFTFDSYGAHCDDYPVPYVTMAASVGMTSGDVDAFINRLNQCMRELKAKGHPSPDGEPSM